MMQLKRNKHTVELPWATSSCKQPALLSAHLTKIPIGSSVSQIAISDHLHGKRPLEPGIKRDRLLEIPLYIIFDSEMRKLTIRGQWVSLSLSFWDVCQQWNMFCNNGFTSGWRSETKRGPGGKNTSSPLPAPIKEKGRKFLFLLKWSSHCRQILLFQTVPSTLNTDPRYKRTIGQVEMSLICHQPRTRQELVIRWPA